MCAASHERQTDSKTDEYYNVPYGGKQWKNTVNYIAIDQNGSYMISAPSKDPGKIYPLVTDTQFGEDRFQEWMLQLVSCGLPEKQKRNVLDSLLDYYSTKAQFSIGYQANNDFNLSDDFFRSVMSLRLNNIGDPFVNGTYKLNTKALERNVLDYFASLWNAKWPSDLDDPESYWGYVLDMGSTEGNLYALKNARDYLNGSKLKFCSYSEVITQQRKALQSQIKTLKILEKQPSSKAVKGKLEKLRNKYTPVIFYSEDTHYSIPKGCHTVQLLNFGDEGNFSYPGQCPITINGSWPNFVPSINGDAGPGEVDIEKLCKLVEFFSSRGYPIVVVLNVGTTFKGAFDDVEEAGVRIMEILKKYGMYMREIQDPDYPDDPSKTELRQGFWIHVDGALGASYIPYIKFAEAHGMLPPNTNTGPIFDFRLPFVSSITTSGHKWSGVAWPTGVYITRQKLVTKHYNCHSFFETPDSTLAGSRNALSAAALWISLASKNYEAKVREILGCLSVTRYAVDKLNELSKQIDIDIRARNKLPSLSVRFRSPCRKINEKYHLSKATFVEDGTPFNYGRIYCMPYVTEEIIDHLIADLSEPGSFDALK